MTPSLAAIEATQTVGRSASPTLDPATIRKSGSSRTVDAGKIEAQISFARMLLGQAESAVVADAMQTTQDSSRELSRLVKMPEKFTLSASETPDTALKTADFGLDDPKSSESTQALTSKPSTHSPDEVKKPTQNAQKQPDLSPSVLPAVAVWFPTSSLRSQESQMNLQTALTPAALNAQQTMTESLGTGTRQGLLSEQMQNALAMAHKYGRAVRVDLNGGTQVIFRLSQGRVSAEFLSQSPGLLSAMLPGQLEALKSRLQDQNLPLESLTIREDTPKGQKQPQKNQSDEQNAD